MKISIYLIRVVHFLISLFFLICIFYLYYSVFANREGPLLYIAIIALLLEGLIVFLNRNNCPLGFLHNKLGDGQTFFELFLPKPLAQKIIPIFAIISILGVVLFFIKKF